MSPYIPISCAFYDHLEAYATLGKNVEIEFKQSIKSSSTTRGVIVDLFITEKVEYLKLNTNEILRLDQIIRVEDKMLQDYNYC